MYVHSMPLAVLNKSKVYEMMKVMYVHVIEEKNRKHS